MLVLKYHVLRSTFEGVMKQCSTIFEGLLQRAFALSFYGIFLGFGSLVLGGFLLGELFLLSLNLFFRGLAPPGKADKQQRYEHNAGNCIFVHVLFLVLYCVFNEIYEEWMWLQHCALILWVILGTNVPLQSRYLYHLYKVAFGVASYTHHASAFIFGKILVVELVAVTVALRIFSFLYISNVREPCLSIHSY